MQICGVDTFFHAHVLETSFAQLDGGAACLDDEFRRVGLLFLDVFQSPVDAASPFSQIRRIRSASDRLSLRSYTSSTKRLVGIWGIPGFDTVIRWEEMVMSIPPCSVKS